MIDIICTSLANIVKMTFPKENKLEETYKRKPFKNKMYVRMRTLKFFEAFATAYVKILAFVDT